MVQLTHEHCINWQEVGEETITHAGCVATVLSPYVFTSFSTRAAIPSVEPISEVSVWNIVKRYAQ